MSGDLVADFGLAGMFWAAEAGLVLTRFRAYDPELGRWLSRDPLPKAEVREGPNLFAYAVNNPINLVDRLGLASDTCCEPYERLVEKIHSVFLPICEALREDARGECFKASIKQFLNPRGAMGLCAAYQQRAEDRCFGVIKVDSVFLEWLRDCLAQ